MRVPPTLFTEAVLNCLSILLNSQFSLQCLDILRPALPIGSHQSLPHQRSWDRGRIFVSAESSHVALRSCCDGCPSTMTGSFTDAVTVLIRGLPKSITTSSGHHAQFSTVWATHTCTNTQTYLFLSQIWSRVVRYPQSTQVLAIYRKPTKQPTDDHYRHATPCQLIVHAALLIRIMQSKD